MNSRSFVLAIAVLSWTADAATGPQNCRPIKGVLSARVLLPPECTAVFCNAGRVWGGLQGTYTLSIPETPLPSGAVASIVFFSGDTLITTELGDRLFGIDTGVLDVGAEGAGGAFASLVTFTGGAGGLQNARGQIQVRGTVDLLNGMTTGEYHGTLCRP